ncbi:condensation domain-containing protein [Gloeobacter morelensis]|uniref:Condensation protein n=1 Tax=Gloeobacter morelensis MG652769 TaxID=2781736 RepID=A0ABY3PJJ9_9CYAN|nr:condensation domain-containing protein [Gloeobacter morelensis]UFP93831.1 condensation protein [Gloeobacter morelensis MG652769]
MNDIQQWLATLSIEQKRSLLAELLQKRASRPQTFPLSFAQQRLWFLDQIEPGSPAYNIPAAVRLSGPLDVAALQRSLDAIVRRHEALRTTFSTQDGQPVQVIAPAAEQVVELPCIDLGLADNEQILQLAAQESRRPFDLACGPLLRATLLRRTPEEHVLLFTVHHIVFDGWSIAIFLRELALLYEGLRSGTPPVLPELAIQYADYAVWQHQQLQGPLLEKHLDYWQQMLERYSPLRFIEERTPGSGADLQTVSQQALMLPQSLLTAVKALAQRSGATLFMVLLAAFKALLHCHAQQTDILVGTPIANRTRVETEGLIGFFANTLVLRTDLSADPSFAQLLARVREVALGAYAHQELPFAKLVEHLQPERHLSRTPLFRVWFVLQEDPLPALQLPGLALSLMEVHPGVARYDLKLSLWEGPEGLKGALEYRPALFDAATVARLAAQWLVLLECVLERPDIRLGELAARLSEFDRQQQSHRHQALQQNALAKLKQAARKTVEES